MPCNAYLLTSDADLLPLDKSAFLPFAGCSIEFLELRDYHLGLKFKSILGFYMQNVLYARVKDIKDSRLLSLIRAGTEDVEYVPRWGLNLPR